MWLKLKWLFQAAGFSPATSEGDQVRADNHYFARSQTAVKRKDSLLKGTYN